MKPRHIDSITLKNILLNIKHSFGLTYTKMAQELDVSTKTLNRWKDGNKTYKTLKKEDYKTLFTLLEQKGACERDSDFVKMLQKWYSELLPYKTKADIKKVIQMSLDYHLNPIPLDEENNSSSIIVHAKEYILSCLDNEKNIDNICMAFHSGWDWLKENEKNQLIELINERGITLRVIVNHRDAIRKIAKTMCDPKMAKHYLGFNEGIKKWNDLAIDLENFEFRISDYPIFRKIYIINYKDGTSEARMRDYVYDYATEYDEVAIHLTHNDSSLHIFQQEFDFLWDRANTYTNWSKNHTIYEEIIPSGEYVMLYLSHKKDSDTPQATNSDFIISALQIVDKDNVKLDVNIAENIYSPLDLKNPEYTYRGLAKLTPHKNIYITLFDENEYEQVSISTRNSIHDQKRFLGIMTALNTQGKPVAYKFVCIEPSLLNKINLTKIKEILQCKNKNWGQDLMIFEDNDMDCFYSNAIFKKEDELP